MIIAWSQQREMGGWEDGRQWLYWYSDFHGRAVFSHDINLSLQKKAEYIRHEEGIYNIDVHLQIMGSHHGEETASRNVSAVHIIVITCCFISGTYKLFFGKDNFY